ncbi:hypothetical protein [Bacillus sp. MRMR6]|uniref:hypothetical protein n=1 Tax=Bacillus sp. MRMR6 TaxID=1928617 RepID=UPI000951E66D|nr:hypothetical protein [Bacillus sp. MRMR6]OLS34591.1 hypothetical protein BTR25_21530 [Bacillus sp. MRMR6]
MKDTLHNFLKTLNERKHVLRLIDHAEKLSVKFCIGEDSIFVAFHRGTAILIDKDLNKLVDCQISGNKKAIQELLEGRDSLRRLYKNGQLKVTASFRTVLLLESIFYLAPEHQQTEIIS